MKTLYQALVFSSVMVAVVGCQTQPTKPAPTTKKTPATSPHPNAAKTPPGIKITPYEQAEIKREPLQVIVPQQQPQNQKFESDGQQLPAVKQLMQQAQAAYKQGQWANVEKYALDAQRLAPQSADTYLYLALAAQAKNQSANAESLARRGLSYAQSNAMKKQLWQSILKAGQQQNNAKTLQEARRQLHALS